MSASNRKEDRSCVDGFEIEIFKLVKDEATSEQWRQWLRTPLEHAAVKGNLDLFTRLIDAGAGGGEPGWQGPGRRERTLLGAAACGDKSDVMVQAVLEAGEADDVNARFGATIESALHVATARGAEEASKALIFAGADPNLRDGNTASPLHLAAEAGHDLTIGILLQNGAQVDARNAFEETPLHLAAAMGRTLCISELLAGGADKDVVDAESETPLFKAAASNHLGAVEALLAACADPSICSHGWSPLETAATSGHATIVKTFLDKDSREVNVSDFHGWTALHYAACVGGPGRDNGDAVRALLKAGADVNVKTDYSDCTPLHVAVNRRVASICTIRALLEGGADVNVRGKDDQTPLHVACMCSNVSGVELLLRWGADYTLTDCFEETPADVIGISADTDRNDEEVEAEDEGVLRALQHGPADWSWHRRGWLVLSRSRPTRVHIAYTSSSSSSSSCRAKVVRVSGEVSGGGDMHMTTEDQMMSDWNDLVGRLVGLEVDSLFRLVVGFL